MDIADVTDTSNNFDDLSDSDIENPIVEERFRLLCADVKECIDCLHSLNVAIANPAPYERFQKFGAGGYLVPRTVRYRLC